jgi:hypothetical protein
MGSEKFIIVFSAYVLNFLLTMQERGIKMAPGSQIL